MVWRRIEESHVVAFQAGGHRHQRDGEVVVVGGERPKLTPRSVADRLGATRRLFLRSAGSVERRGGVLTGMEDSHDLDHVPLEAVVEDVALDRIGAQARNEAVPGGTESRIVEQCGKPARDRPIVAIGLPGVPPGFRVEQDVVVVPLGTRGEAHGRLRDRHRGPVRHRL